MRWPLIFVGTVLAAGQVAATPPSPSQAPGNKSDPSTSNTEAQAYAQYVIDLADQVTHTYVRPVSQVDLLAAALAGLYEALQAPVPDNLKADLNAAATPNQM